MGTSGRSVFTVRMLKFALLTFLLVAGSYAWDRQTEMEEESDADEILRILEKPRELARDKAVRMNLGPLKYTFKNCGGRKDMASVTSVKVTPDPVVLPGTIKVTAKGVVKETVTAPFKVSVKLEKKILFWITVPCKDNVGSCTYADVCPMIPPVPDCPPGLTCNCPFKKGPLDLPETEVDLTSVVLPNIATGDFRLTLKGSHGKKPVFCTQVYASLKQKKKDGTEDPEYVEEFPEVDPEEAEEITTEDV